MNYARDGYTVVPLFDVEEVGAMRKAVAAYIDRVSHALLKPYYETAPYTDLEDRLERIARSDQSLAGLLANAVQTDAHRAPVIASLAKDERLESLAADLTGARITQKIFRLRLNCSALTAQRQGWHSDLARLDTSARAQLLITGWIPLADAGPDNGGLEFVHGRRDRPISHDRSDGKFLIESDRLIRSDKRTPKVPAGHCLFMDRFTPHRAVENASGKTRFSLVVWMKGELAGGSTHAVPTNTMTLAG